eukprot:6702119-Pyramimonas_sp.AAC.1
MSSRRLRLVPDSASPFCLRGARSLELLRPHVCRPRLLNVGLACRCKSRPPFLFSCLLYTSPSPRDRSLS